MSECEEVPLNLNAVARYIREKDAEIARLKLENSTLEHRVELRDGLIAELADELERFHRYAEGLDLSIMIDYGLIRKARGVVE